MLKCNKNYQKKAKQILISVNEMKECTHTHTSHIYRGHIALHCNRPDENTYSLNYSIFEILSLWKTAVRVQIDRSSYFRSWLISFDFDLILCLRDDINKKNNNDWQSANSKHNQRQLRLAIANRIEFYTTLYEKANVWIQSVDQKQNCSIFSFESTKLDPYWSKLLLFVNRSRKKCIKSTK